MKIKGSFLSKQSKRGITLIALVVTIVVLLILAGVSIAMLSGENGIIRQAQEAKLETEIATEKEQLNLAVTDAKSPGLVINENTLTSVTLQEALDKIAGDNKTEVSGDETLTVVFKDSNRTYYVTTGGNVKDTKPEVNIYKYTNDGYITGLKDEYITMAKSNNDIGLKYASIDKIKVSVAEAEYYLADELNGILKIPNEIEGTNIIGIKSNAFSNIRNLKKVIISEGITEICGHAIRSCVNLIQIKIPESVTKIGNCAFAYNDSLINVIIPSNVTEMEGYSFDGCDNLERIIIQQEEGSLENEPWGAYNATVIYLGKDGKMTKEVFSMTFLSEKTQEELEEIFLITMQYEGTFEQFLSDKGMTRTDLENEASSKNKTYNEYLQYMLYEVSPWVNIEYQIYLQDEQWKTIEELRDLCAKKQGLDSFEQFLKEKGITMETWQKMVNENKSYFRTEENILKFIIYGQ